jgi:DNA-binding IclR family transcriptional regulator
MTWREAVEAAVRRYASKCEGGTFTRQDFLAEEERRIVSDCGGGGKTPRQTISRVLQELRDDGVVAFVDDRGAYRLTS